MHSGYKFVIIFRWDFKVDTFSLVYLKTILINNRGGEKATRNGRNFISMDYDNHVDKTKT